MKEKTSKRIFIAEFIFFSLPLTVLYVWGTGLVIMAIRAGSDWGPVSTFGQLILIGVSLVSYYILSYKLLRYGSVSLFNANGFYWSFIFLGMLYSLIGIIPLVGMIFNIVEFKYLFSFFRFGVFGIILIPSAMHLYLESRRGQSLEYQVTIPDNEKG